MGPLSISYFTQFIYLRGKMKENYQLTTDEIKKEYQLTVNT